MKQIKKQIIDIIRGYQEDERSSTGITGEKIIYGYSDESISDDIVNLIQTIFDPENQPNQLGIENPFKQTEAISFEEAARPLMKYLGENHHPHTSAYVRNDLAELLEGQEAFGTKDYILD